MRYGLAIIVILILPTIPITNVHGCTIAGLDLTESYYQIEIYDSDKELLYTFDTDAYSIPCGPIPQVIVGTENQLIFEYSYEQAVMVDISDISSDRWEDYQINSEINLSRLTSLKTFNQSHALLRNIHDDPFIFRQMNFSTNNSIPYLNKTKLIGDLRIESYRFNFSDDTVSSISQTTDFNTFSAVVNGEYILTAIDYDSEVIGYNENSSLVYKTDKNADAVLLYNWYTKNYTIFHGLMIAAAALDNGFLVKFENQTKLMITDQGVQDGEWSDETTFPLVGTYADLNSWYYKLENYFVKRSVVDRIDMKIVPILVFLASALIALPSWLIYKWKFKE